MVLNSFENVCNRSRYSQLLKDAENEFGAKGLSPIGNLSRFLADLLLRAIRAFDNSEAEKSSPPPKGRTGSQHLRERAHL